MQDSTMALDVTTVTAGYAGRTVIHEVSVRIPAGQSVALIGPNGCGKSTLLRVIAGTVQADSGTVSLAGVQLVRKPTDDRIRQGLGYLPQTRNIFAGLTVQENLQLAAEALLGREDAESRTKRVLGAFAMLQERKAERAGLLSGGQRQALAVAMVLMRPSRLLLLDEPVAGLSPAAGSNLMAALRSLQKEEGFATVIVEHRLKQVQPEVDRVLVMREGSIVDDTLETQRMLDAAWLAGHYTNGLRSP